MEKARAFGARAISSPIAKLGIVALGASPAPLDNAVNVALPAITRHFGLALADVQWLVVCYVLVFGSLMLVCGKIGDLVGHRRIFRTGLLVTAAGCAACAIAPDWSLFLSARTVQGFGTALALSCTPALATAVYPPEQRVKALAAYAMAMAVAGALGPLLGGVLVATWDWQAVYWVRVPIALLALGLSGALPSAQHTQSRHFDFSGAILLAASMGMLLLALVLSQRPGVSGWTALGLLAVALALLHRYVMRSLSSAEPIIRPELFADAAFTIPNVMNALANLAGFAILLLTPYYFINVLHLSAVMSGLLLALAYTGMLAGAPLAARLVPRIGPRATVFAGILIAGLGLLPLGLTGPAASVPLVAFLLVLQGLGQGLVNVAYTDLVTGTLPERDRGVAGSLALLTRTVGIVGGASILTTLHAWGGGGGADFLAGYRFAFLGAGGGLLIALTLSCLWWRAWFRRSPGGL
jgi:EmrB/QacA subfamily drug resistance transporter